MKKMILLVLTLSILISTSVHADTVKFSDTKGHWAEANIEKLVDLGIINGYPDGTFKPNETITVAQFTKMVVAAIGFPNLKTEMIHPYQHWSEEYMFKAQEFDLINDNYSPYIFSAHRAEKKGLEILDGQFGKYYVEQPIDREQMATTIVNAYEYLYKETIPVNADYSGGIKDFAYLLGGNERAILKSYEIGLIAGQGNGVFNSKGNATRAEAATVILRLLEPDYRVKTAITPDMSANAFKLEPELSKADKEAIFKDLAKYKNINKDDSNTYAEAVAEYQSDLRGQFFDSTIGNPVVDIATGTISSFYNTDYRFRPSWDRDDFLYYVHNTWHYMSSEYGKGGHHPFDLYEVLKKEDQKYHRISRQFFVTDTENFSTSYTTGASYYIVRGRYYFIFDGHNVPERISDELEGHESPKIVYEVGKWYYVDAECIITSKANFGYDWKKSEFGLWGMHYLNEPVPIG